MKARRNFTKAVGVTQAIFGALTVVFAFLLFYNVLGIQVVMGFSAGHVEFYLWVLIILGLLSIISGLFLAYEE